MGPYLQRNNMYTDQKGGPQWSSESWTCLFFTVVPISFFGNHLILYTSSKWDSAIIIMGFLFPDILLTFLIYLLFTLRWYHAEMYMYQALLIYFNMEVKPGRGGPGCELEKSLPLILWVALWSLENINVPFPHCQKKSSALLMALWLPLIIRS